MSRRSVGTQPQDERWLEIGVIFARGIARLVSQSEEVRWVRPIPVAELAADPVERAILLHLQGAVSSTPRRMRRALGIPHTSLVRRLGRLRLKGMVIATGRTRSVCYELSDVGRLSPGVGHSSVNATLEGAS